MLLLLCLPSFPHQEAEQRQVSSRVLIFLELPDTHSLQLTWVLGDWDEVIQQHIAFDGAISLLRILEQVFSKCDSRDQSL